MPQILPVAKTAGLTAEELGDELVIYNEQRELVLRLNRPATLVWRNSDGNHTVADLVAVLTEELGELANEDQVMIALDELAKHGLIESGYEQREPDAVRLSRRSFVRRVGVVAVAAVGVPAVYSLLAPELAAGGSLKHHYHYVYHPPVHHHNHHNFHNHHHHHA